MDESHDCLKPLTDAGADGISPKVLKAQSSKLHITTVIALVGIAYLANAKTFGLVSHRLLLTAVKCYGNDLSAIN